MEVFGISADAEVKARLQRNNLLLVFRSMKECSAEPSGSDLRLLKLGRWAHREMLLLTLGPFCVFHKGVKSIDMSSDSDHTRKTFRGGCSDNACIPSTNSEFTYLDTATRLHAINCVIKDSSLECMTSPQSRLHLSALAVQRHFQLHLRS